MKQASKGETARGGGQKFQGRQTSRGAEGAGNLGGVEVVGGLFFFKALFLKPVPCELVYFLHGGMLQTRIPAVQVRLRLRPSNSPQD